MINLYLLGEKLSTIRKKNGFTQEQIAEILNISVKTLQRIESGSKIIDIETLNILSIVYKTVFVK